MKGIFNEPITQTQLLKSIDGEEMTQEEVIKAVIEMLKGTNENGVEKDD